VHKGHDMLLSLLYSIENIDKPSILNLVLLLNYVKYYIYSILQSKDTKFVENLILNFACNTFMFKIYIKSRNKIENIFSKIKKPQSNIKNKKILY
jgi:hypothetical protein